MTNAQKQEQNPYAEAIAHHRAGRLEEAETAFKDVLTGREDDAEAHNMLGIFYFQTRNFEKALPCFSRAVELNDQKLDYHKNLAAAQLHTGAFEASEKTLVRALELNPDYAEGHFNLGIALEQQKRLPEAIKSYKKATEKAPLLDAYNNLGRLYMLTGKNKEAEESFKAALAHNPDYDKAAANLCGLYKAQGRMEEALEMAIRAVNANPQASNNKIILTSLIAGHPVKSFSPEFKEALTRVLQDRFVDLRKISQSWAGVLRLDPAFALWIRAAQEKDYDSFKAHLLKADFSALNDPFILSGLQEIINSDETLERLFTFLRCYLLESIADTDLAAGDDDFGRFPYALAEQCFYNEYIFYASDKEQEWLQTLRQKLERIENPGPEYHLALAVYAAYKPLSTLNHAAAIEKTANASGDDKLKMLAAGQITARREEQEIADHIETIGSLKRDESAEFKDIYEKHPYPRWKSYDFYQTPFDHAQDTRLKDRPRPQILIAGCGTGRHALVAALKYRHADILAIDFTRSSLAYAQRKTRELGVKNITYKQADILEIGKLGAETFDALECIGTLHHMKDPFEGWAALNKVLKPGGSMNIGTYSKLARQNIEATRAFTREKGFKPVPEGIRAARQAIFDLPADNPARAVAAYIDFYTLSECRFHIMDIEEHPLTLPEIAEFTEANNIRIERFYGIAPYYLEMYKERFPDDTAMTDLDNWHALEQEHPALFGAMYQFIARKG